ncbi:MAG: hypothetical protein ACD_80C00110G0003, partial [uncultured bacterium (gcode 4)]
VFEVCFFAWDGLKSLLMGGLYLKKGSTPMSLGGMGCKGEVICSLKWVNQSVKCPLVKE